MKTLLSTVAILCAGALQAQELQLYNWGDYTSPELLTKFEEETGIKVTVTDYDSNDTALAKVEAGGHGFDLVVPSANYIPIWREKGLIQELDLSKLSNHGNIAPQWVDVAFDPGRKFSIPWQIGATGIAVNSDAYDGDINTSAIFLDTPEELVGKVNVTPEMNDIMSLALWYVGGEPCTEDTEKLKAARDALIKAKPNWQSMDYGMSEKLAANDVMSSVYWNGAVFRASLQNDKVKFGYPQEGFPLFMDSVALLSDAQNVEEAYQFMNFIMLPENAALISEFARYANGIAGSEEFMDEEMKTSPMVNIPPELAEAGEFLPTCSAKSLEYYTAIWTELQK
ncbi:spermidine/putrescine transport system substrate-binding protein [Loktanella atrilutea]|uniref:Spermidine/putrescine transport system substrate-binding protein n=1 Tax=Loktanella atrilutea TaxID=366533 RepID=A0A1M4V8J1_LOKAT|nr:extracellular solute-binding protein [Loktanella atrilutea]SHE65200.1 spermidine/putrescine transport system substrate-binding protein [Loktanella atrilutea]